MPDLTLPLRCAVAALLATSLFAQTPQPGARLSEGERAWKFFAERHDKNRDGKVGKDEYGRGDAKFAQLDRDEDGVLTSADFGSAPRRPRGERPASRPSRPAAASLPKVGDTAPDFELPVLGEKERTVRLSSYAGKRPVALVFGSYS
jgi:hypothetical protein